MLERIINILRDYVDDDIEITKQTNLVEDLSLTSLDYVRLIKDFEDEFNIKIKQQDYIDIETVGDILNKIKYIRKR